MAAIKITGLDELEKALKENVKMEDVKRVVKFNGSQLHRTMIKNADFVKGYQTGTTKRSIGLEISDGGFTATVWPGTHYSQYLEYGTRYMDAQPFVRPSLEAQETKFKADMQKLVR